MGLAMVLGGLNSGGLLGLRALADAKASLRARLRSTVWLVLCPLVGAVLGDAWGFAAGFAVARLAAAWIWWSAFRHSLDERAKAAAASASDPEVEPA